MSKSRFMYWHWPEKYQALQEWSKVKPYCRQAFGRYLGWALGQQRDPFDPSVVRAFAQYLKNSSSAAHTTTTLGGLSLCLMRLRPDDRWDWLRDLQRGSGIEARQRRKRAPSKKGGRRRTLSVTIEEWPLAIGNAWKNATSEGVASMEFPEFSDGGGILAEWSRCSVRTAEQGYSYFLASASKSGDAPSVTPDSIRRFVKKLRARRLRVRRGDSPPSLEPLRATTIATYVEAVLTVMSIAMPDGDWRWLRDEVNRLKTEARYASKRKEGRVIHGVELFGLGLTLCELARRSRPELARTATLFRDGLIFLTLAIAPARVSSFLAIEIGEHLDLEGPKAMLRWGADETKEDRPERYPVWPIVRKHIEEYLAVYRPVLARSYSGTELWVASDGRGPLSYAALWKAVHVQSLKYLGIAYSPHLARDTVALTVSEELPEAMEIATAMLHHASSKSTEPYRHQANTISASRVARRMQQQARERAKRTLREAEINPQPQAVDEIFAKYA